MATELEALVQKLILDTKQYQSGLQTAATALGKFTDQNDKSVSKMNNAFTSLQRRIATAFSVGAIILFTRSLLENAEQLQKTSQITGIAIDKLSELQFVASQSNIEFGELTNSLRLASRNIADASNDTGGAVQAIKNLGLSARELAAQTPDQQLNSIAKAMSGVATQGEKASIAVDIFGRTGDRLLPILQDGGTKMAALRDEAQRLGIVVDEATNDKLVKAKDNMEKFQAVVTSLGRNLAVDLLPGLTKVVEWLSQLFEFIKKIVPSFIALGIEAKRFFGIISDQEADERFEALFMTLNARVIPAVNATASATDKYSKSAQDLIKELEEELKLLKLAAPEREKAKNMIKAGADASEEQKNRVAELSDEIRKLKDAEEAAKDELEKSKQVAREFGSTFESAFEDAILDGKSLRDVISGLDRDIAKMILRFTVTQPLAEGIGSIFSSSGGGFGGLFSGIGKGIGDFFGGFFADGGNPPVGKPSIVGENGPEIIVPRQPMTVIPNSMTSGGDNISVSNNFYLSMGVTETVRSEIAAFIPTFRKVSVESILSAVQQGGKVTAAFGLKG